ncbi:MAG: hypothetical protein ABF449_00610 [Ethanoligenens sp.]
MIYSINEKSIVIIETDRMLSKADRERQESDLAKKLGCKACILDAGQHLGFILSGE